MLRLMRVWMIMVFMVEAQYLRAVETNSMREVVAKQDGVLEKRKGMAKGLSGEQIQKGLERIKEHDVAAYLELLDLKEKDPVQFRVKFAEYAKAYGIHKKGSAPKKKK